MKRKTINKLYTIGIISNIIVPIVLITGVWFDIKLFVNISITVLIVDSALEAISNILKKKLKSIIDHQLTKTL